ncbi:WD-repeats-region domain-containing protein [Favolaschia claudopus]|uniref:WD-repeats-region domain-containing protein n=1 Tax=Favolaschia claudopus TaxID=2862362 RepID=A0AAW0B2N4_9AGAR
MGDSAIWTIATGTVIVSVASTCITGLYATFTGRTHQRLATSSALNSTITSATFFTLREYIFSPFVRIAIGRKENTSSDNLSWSDLRRRNLLDSGLSGAATGGIYRGLTAGRRTIGRAATTAGIACVVLQVAYNELAIQRIKYVAGLSQTSAAGVKQPEFSEPWTTKMLSVLGVRPVSDEELLDKLRRERTKHLEKIQELEHQVEAERKQQEGNPPREK